MADCDNDQECEKIVPTPIKPEPLPKQCSGGDESGGGTNDFNELDNRPKYGGRKMTGDTDIPDLSATIEQLSGEVNVKTPMITNYDGEVGENVADQRPYIVTEDKDSITPEELVNETTESGASLVVEVDTNEGTAKLYTAQIVTDAGTGDLAIEWAEVGGGSSVVIVQTTGTSETDVMSQKAATSMIYADPNLRNRIKIGQGANTGIGDNAIEIGHDTKALSLRSVSLGSDAKVENWSSDSIALGPSSQVNTAEHAVAIGYSSYVNAEKGLALGRGATVNHSFGVALGAGSATSAQGEINVGTGSLYTTKGYNNSNYRLLSGLYDGQGAHDAVTVGQINNLIDAINTAAGINISHIGA